MTRRPTPAGPIGGPHTRGAGGGQPHPARPGAGTEFAGGCSFRPEERATPHGRKREGTTMPEEPKGAGPAQDLPEPLPELLPAADEGPAARREYFDPERWDAEVTHGRPADDRDPVATGVGRVEGRGRAALFVSDFHMSDGTTAGDDSLDAHLHFDERFDCYTGFFPPGGTKARLFASVVT